jgi:hypothetical protein
MRTRDRERESQINDFHARCRDRFANSAATSKQNASSPKEMFPIPATRKRFTQNISDKAVKSDGSGIPR